MTTALSTDLRRRVVDAYRDGDETYVEIAKRFDVGEASVDRWLRLSRETGDVLPLPGKGGRKPKINEDGLKELRRLVEEQPDATLAELSERYKERVGVNVAVSIICRALKKLKLSRKKRQSMPRSNSETTFS